MTTKQIAKLNNKIALGNDLRQVRRNYQETKQQLNKATNVWLVLKSILRYGVRDKAVMAMYRQANHDRKQLIELNTINKYQWKALHSLYSGYVQEAQVTPVVATVTPSVVQRKAITVYAGKRFDLMETIDR